jgi:hypothetical protein
MTHIRRVTTVVTTLLLGAVLVAAPVSAQSGATPPADGHDMTEHTTGLGSLGIRAFGDVDFRSLQHDELPNTFHLGQLDLFLSSKLSDTLSVVGELVAEAGDDNVITADVERLLLQYTPNEYLSVSAGRYHTAIGYYNAAYHHGLIFQTAVDRPFIYRFEDEGGLLPVHGVGLSAQGKIPSGPLGLRYIAEVSNGRSSDPKVEAVQTSVDSDAHKSVNVGLISRPLAVPGLQVGVSVYRDRMGAPFSGNETIVAAHGVYRESGVEVLSEIISIRHELSQATATTTSFYAQGSVEVKNFRPYVRYESLDVPAADAVFAAYAGRSQGPSVGIRFDPHDAVALKLQYTNMTGAAGGQMTGLTAQVAFVF